MQTFLDESVLARRREVTDLWFWRLSRWLRNGWLDRAEAKQGVLDLRTAGAIDDTECEGLLERLGLGAS